MPVGNTAVPKALADTRLTRYNPAPRRYNRIFKKSSQDGNLVLFLPHRELMVTETRVEPLIGVALVHESLLQTKAVKVYLQVVLMFR